jgi:hypothetical protein
MVALKNINRSVKMLRHIISVSLAMTACAILIPTKTNAVTLTVRPGGELPRRTGDTIEFIFELNPAPSAPVIFKGFGFVSDANELAIQSGGYTIAENTVINTAIIVATRIFTVRTPVNDEPGRGDVNASVSYDQPGPSGTPVRLSVFGSGGDVVPVPEPLTILGAATALGYGAILKRQSFKNKKS